MDPMLCTAAFGWVALDPGSSILCTESSRLPNSTSIFSAEIAAMLDALHYVLTAPPGRVVVATDSLSTLQALEGSTSAPSLDLSDILRLLSLCQERDIKVILLWVPGHMGVLGNEVADQAARAGLDLPPPSLPRFYQLRDTLSHPPRLGNLDCAMDGISYFPAPADLCQRPPGPFPPLVLSPERRPSVPSSSRPHSPPGIPLSPEHCLLPILPPLSVP